jgi:hypothetical protein
VRRERARRALTRIRFNCADETHRILEVVRYRPDGSILSSDSAPDTGRSGPAVAPGSVMESVMRPICTYAIYHLRSSGSR